MPMGASETTLDTAWKSLFLLRSSCGRSLHWRLHLLHADGSFRDDLGHGMEELVLAQIELRAQPALAASLAPCRWELPRRPWTRHGRACSCSDRAAGAACTGGFTCSMPMGASETTLDTAWKSLFLLR